MDVIERRICQLERQSADISRRTTISLKRIREEIRRLKALRGRVVESDTFEEKARAVEEARSEYRKHSRPDWLSDGRR